MGSLELAISIGRDIERVGALAGYASILGLAILSLLYFAQSREVKRLREWAGRAPERDADLQQRVTEAAAQRASAPVTPKPAAGANVPATAAAQAAAKPATPAPAPAKPGTPAAAPPAAGAPKPATPGAPATPPGAPPAAGATPKPATPAPAVPASPAAAKPPTPAPAPATAAAAARPRRTVTVGSTPSSATVPAREDADDGGSSLFTARTALLSALGVALLVVVLLVSGVIGGGGDEDGGGAATTPQTTTTAAEEGAPPAPEDTAVAVLNGTTVTGLARNAADQLEEADYSVVRVTDAADQAQQTSQVAYSDGFRGSARTIARLVGVDAANVVPLDESTRVIAGNDVSVVVTMAADMAS